MGGFPPEMEKWDPLFVTRCAFQLAVIPGSFLRAEDSDLLELYELQALLAELAVREQKERAYAMPLPSMSCSPFTLGLNVHKRTQLT